MWGIAGLETILPANPPLPPLRIDLRVLAFAATVAMLAGILVGTIPALRISRANLYASLSSGDRGATAGAPERRAQQALVTAQIALALALLVCTSMLIRTAVGRRMADLGFEADNLLIFQMRPPQSEYPDSESLRRFYTRLEDRLKALPGVISVASASSPPLTGRDARESYSPVGEEVEDRQWPVSSVRWIDAGYFATLGVPVIRGRGFVDGDVEGAPPVVVISEGLAARHWADENPVSRRLEAIGRTWEIVGVVRDLHHYGPDSPVTPIIYFPASQSQPRETTVLVRTAAESSDLMAPVRAVVRAIDPDQPIFEVTTMRERLRRGFDGARVISQVSAVLGAVALIMAVLGIYGVMAYSMVQRTHETGIRIALGAHRRDIVHLMARKGARLSLLGVALGIALSLGMMRVFDAIFDDFVGFDGLSLGIASTVLLLAALGAGYLPARRAANLDPIEALRHQ